MKQSALLTAFCLLTSCEVVSVSADPVVAFHGDKAFDILTGPRYVDTFRLDPLSYGSDEAGERLAGYVVVTHGPRLDDEQQVELIGLLANEGNYGFGFDHSCAFRPEVGLRFVQSVEYVDMLICFECNEWQFEHAGRAVGEQFHRRNVRPRLVTLAKALFDDDVVIRGLREE
jgi:hypothetical protein